MTKVRRRGWAIETGDMMEPMFFTNGYSKMRCNDGTPIPEWTDSFDHAHLWRTMEGALAAAQEWAFPPTLYRIKWYDTE